MLTGAHGTNFDNIKLIQENNFIESNSYDEWLGDGAYFFVDGCSTELTENFALKWAQAHHWDNINRCYTCKEVASFEVDINYDEDKILDLTIREGLKIFNLYRENLIKKIKAELGLKFKKNIKELTDNDLLNSIKNKLEIDIIKSDMYIKFEFERICRVESRIPNCTIIAVTNSKRNIDTTTIRNINKIELEVYNGL